MFSRALKSPVKKDPSDSSWGNSPTRELSDRLNRLEDIIQQTKDAYIESIQPPAENSTPSRKERLLGTAVGALKTLSGRPSSDDKSLEGDSSDYVNGRTKQREVKFIPMKNKVEQESIELIRRIAELVVIGERAAAAEEKKQMKRSDEEAANDQSNETEKYLALFEYFFERNGLGLMVDIVTGAAFSLKEKEDGRKRSDSDGKSEDLAIASNFLKDISEDTDCTLLPPTTVSTQAIQSISLLVQNSSRITSLYFILSNNHINELIDFPLEHYEEAELKKLNSDAKRNNLRHFGSPELAEMKTLFITFLKSLAMRMNVETLQFFLAFPDDKDDGDRHGSTDASPPIDSKPSEEDMPMDEARPLDEIEGDASASEENHRLVNVKEVRVEFPLYARALDFCAAHQDNFVRTTAMNICLNTLRLATVQASNESDVDMNERIADMASGSSPDGVLHNAKPLPLRERLAIAQHVCAPSRVERLVSPIFTKLAQFWGLLEEQFRDVESGQVPAATAASETEAAVGKSSVSAKLARAKAAARKNKSLNTFNDIADSLQDELLLLEDMLRVGLTSLNEQAIEMMLATFAYPLLLQPLLLYFQRSPLPDEVLFADPLNEHTAGRDLKYSTSGSEDKTSVSAPAKSALFTISSVFQLVTNQPLLRLLFTAIFHPLSPSVTGEVMIRAKADVAVLDSSGNVTLRLDPMNSEGELFTETDRSTYLFGSVTGVKHRSAIPGLKKNGGSDCVFVLAPILAEILEFRGESLDLVARARHNPYRKAIFKCITLSNDLSDLRPLAVMALESAVSSFDEKFAADLMLGLDLKKLSDENPLDERKDDSKWAHVLDDRDMGGPGSHDSRLSIGEPTGGKIGFDHTNEVLNSFRSSILYAVPCEQGTWKLEYDPAAAHALLCMVRGTPSAVQGGAKIADRRCRQAAAFLSDMPSNIDDCVEVFESGKSLKSKAEESRVGLVMDMGFQDKRRSDRKALVDDFLQLKSEHRSSGNYGQSVVVSMKGSFGELCKRASIFAPTSEISGEAAVENMKTSVSSWVKLDALSMLMKNLATANDSSILKGRKLGGFVSDEEGTIISTHEPSLIRSVASNEFCKIFFEKDAQVMAEQPRAGSVVGLVGNTAIPCVCEVQPNCAPLFSVAGAKVVSEGITWQSLYLVVLDKYLLLAEPERNSSGDGRIVTSCPLEQLEVDKDPDDQVSMESTARRLIISYFDYGMKPPGMFFFEEEPKVQEIGPFNKVVQWESTLDVWFEDDRAANHALGIIQGKINLHRAERGNRMRRYLAQGDGSTYSRDARA